MSSEQFKPFGTLTPWSWLLPIVLSGCSMGRGGYSCPANTDGVRCLSTREVYQRTHHGQVPGPTVIEHGRIVAQAPAVPAAAAPSTEPANTAPYVAPKPMDSYTPVRTPSRVMRIWIAPWEEMQGDLVMSGYLYTEIEPRRWAVGVPAAKSLDTGSYTPLASGGSKKINRNNQEKK